MVPVEGIEPTLLAEHDFESCASTNSATRAGGAIIAREGGGSTSHTIAAFAPLYGVPSHRSGAQASNAAREEPDCIPPNSLGGHRRRRRGRCDDSGRLVLPIWARPCSLPALSRAALCILLRGAARSHDRARRPG